jgi:hypothetical protein
MAVQHGYGKIAGTDALVFAYDTGDTRSSYKGEPTVNYVPGTYGYSVYAYVSGPVDTTVLNESNKSITAKRYTITQAINTARAAIFPSGLTAGVSFTFSFKWKYNGTTTASPSVGIDASKGNPEGGANNNSFTSATTNTVSIGNGWYLSTYTFVFSSVPTGQCMLTFGIVTGSTAGFVGETFDIYEAQFEIKNHRTQYSSGTRSATQGLLDLTGNSSIDLSNVSFDSNAQMTWDGTDDYVQGAASINYPTAWTDAYTLECMMYVPASATWFTTYVSSLIMKGSYAGSHGLVRSNVENTLAMWVRGDNGAIAASTTVSRDTWTHIVGVWTGEQVQIYKNGTLANTAGSARTGIPDGGGWRIGQASAASGDVGNTYEGYLPVVKFYNRALTAAEVANNYNHYKGRFNI